MGIIEEPCNDILEWHIAEQKEVLERIAAIQFIHLSFIDEPDEGGAKYETTG